MTKVVICGTVLIGVMLLSASFAAAVQVDAIQVRGKTIKVGDNADYVFAVLKKSEVVKQDVKPDPKIPGSLLVTKYYEADGQTFVMSFARLRDPGPYVVTMINLDAAAAPPRADSLSIVAFDKSTFLKKYKPRDKDSWKLKTGGKNHYYSFPDPENPYSGMSVELSSDPVDIRRIGVVWSGESTLSPGQLTKQKEEFLRDLLASTFSAINADSAIAYIRGQQKKHYPGGGNDMPRKLITGIAVHAGTCGEALYVGFEK